MNGCSCLLGSYFLQIDVKEVAESDDLFLEAALSIKEALVYLLTIVIRLYINDVLVVILPGNLFRFVDIFILNK